jgi:hypothetical protein
VVAYHSLAITATFASRLQDLKLTRFIVVIINVPIVAAAVYKPDVINLFLLSNMLTSMALPLTFFSYFSNSFFLGGISAGFGILQLFPPLSWT